MIDNKNIKKGAPSRRPECYQVLQDIVIPAGTILRHDGSNFFCDIGLNTATAFLSVEENPLIGSSGFFKKVIA